MVPAYDNSSNTASLNANVPSVAEAIAVLTSVTLMISSQDAPYVPFWNYSGYANQILPSPVQQIFNATLQSSGYASGHAVNWQKSFYVVLVLAFLVPNHLRKTTEIEHGLCTRSPTWRRFAA